MKLKLVLLFCMNIQLLWAQVTVLNVSLFKEDKKVNWGMQLDVYWNHKKIPLFVRDSMVFIPDSLSGQQVDLVLTTQHYQFHFDKLTIGWNPNYLYWFIYLDFPPIHEKWKWSDPTQLKHAKWLFAIQKGTGTNVIFYGFKRPKNGVLKIN